MIDRRDFLRRFLKGAVIAAVAPEAIARACEEAGVAKGTVFSFGSQNGADIRNYKQFFGAAEQRLYGAIARGASADTSYISVLSQKYRGITFGECDLPLRVKYDGVQGKIRKLWTPLLVPLRLTPVG